MFGQNPVALTHLLTSDVVGNWLDMCFARTPSAINRLNVGKSPDDVDNRSIVSKRIPSTQITTTRLSLAT